MTTTANPQAQPHTTTPLFIEPLTFLARVAQSAIPPDSMASLGFQLASAIAQLGSFIRVRGDESIEHHYGTALTLACLEPLAHERRPYEVLLYIFTRFDRRSPTLPGLVPTSQFRVHKSSTIHFIQQLRDQSAFQAVYQAARQVEAYGARSQSPRKFDRIVLLSREIAGRPLLEHVTPIEELYLKIATKG